MIHIFVLIVIAKRPYNGVLLMHGRDAAGSLHFLYFPLRGFIKTLGPTRLLSSVPRPSRICRVASVHSRDAREGRTMLDSNGLEAAAEDNRRFGPSVIITPLSGNYKN